MTSNHEAIARWYWVDTYASVCATLAVARITLPPGHADRYQGIVDVGPGVAHPLGAATVENELKSDLRSACRSVWASHADGPTSTFSLND